MHCVYSWCVVYTFVRCEKLEDIKGVNRGRTYH